MYLYERESFDFGSGNLCENRMSCQLSCLRRRAADALLLRTLWRSREGDWHFRLPRICVAPGMVVHCHRTKNAVACCCRMLDAAERCCRFAAIRQGRAAACFTRWIVAAALSQVAVARRCRQNDTTARHSRLNFYGGAVNLL